MRSLILLAFFAAVVTANAETNLVQQVALRSLTTFRKVVTPQNYQALGFDSTNDVQALQLSEPLTVYRVSLDYLRAWKPSRDPNLLLTETNTVMIFFPVTVNQHVRSSVTVEKDKKDWKATSFGSPKLIKLLAKARQDSTEATHLPLASYSVVQVPGLNAWLIAYRAQEQLMLASIVDDPDLKLTAGSPLTAQEMFKLLARGAHDQNAFPK
jgi:hypothetical protein